MKEEKCIGKIRSVKFGFGGYQDAQFGLSVEMGSDKTHWSAGAFWGFWGTDWSPTCKWTEQNRVKYLGETAVRIMRLLQEAKVDSVDELVGKPVEVTFRDNILASWRILTEAL